MKPKSYHRAVLVTFEGFDGESRPALAEQRKNGCWRVDYFVDLPAGRSRHVSAYLDRHDAKARLSPIQRRTS